MMEFGSVSGEQWAIIATGLGAVSAALWKFISWLQLKGTQLIVWAKPHVEGLVYEQRDLLKVLKETQESGAEHLKSIDGRLTAHTEILTKIDKQTCQKTPESNA
jgi:hypothetical protein